jgi:hypothetical protein
MGNIYRLEFRVEQDYKEALEKYQEIGNEVEEARHNLILPNGSPVSEDEIKTHVIKRIDDSPFSYEELMGLAYDVWGKAAADWHSKETVKR